MSDRVPVDPADVAQLAGVRVAFRLDRERAGLDVADRDHLHVAERHLHPGVQATVPGEQGQETGLPGVLACSFVMPARMRRRAVLRCPCGREESYLELGVCNPTDVLRTLMHAGWCEMNPHGFEYALERDDERIYALGCGFVVHAGADEAWNDSIPDTYGEGWKATRPLADDS